MTIGTWILRLLGYEPGPAAYAWASPGFLVDTHARTLDPKPNSPKPNHHSAQGTRTPASHDVLHLPGCGCWQVHGAGYSRKPLRGGSSHPGLLFGESLTLLLLSDARQLVHRPSSGDQREISEVKAVVDSPRSRMLFRIFMALPLGTTA